MNESFDWQKAFGLGDARLVVRKEKQGKARFYRIPEQWFDAACDALASPAQVKIAAKLYQEALIRDRKGWDPVIVVGSSFSGKGRSAIHTRQRALKRLAQARLIMWPPEVQGGLRACG